MVMRTLAALSLVIGIGIGNGLHAQLKPSTAKVGDHLTIRMTGDLAKEYARIIIGSRRVNFERDVENIEAIATVVQELDDGRLRIEHTSHVIRGGETTRLVTLTATVAPSEIRIIIRPKGTLVSASPGSELMPTPESIESFMLRLSDLTGLKLRTWTLSDSIGD